MGFSALIFKVSDTSCQGPLRGSKEGAPRLLRGYLRFTNRRAQANEQETASHGPSAFQLLLSQENSRRLELSAPKSRDPLRLRQRFSPLPRRIARFLRPQENRAISSAKKIASERRFSLRFKGPNLIPIAEFLAIPESAAKKIASERRCTFSGKLEKAGTVDFKKSPRTEGGDKVQAVSTQGSRQLCLSRWPKS